MAAGVPVVQPRHGAFPEIIAKTRGGLLVDPNNHDSLADGIFSIATNPDLAQQLSSNGFAGVRTHYSVARMADRALEVYRAVLERHEESGYPRSTRRITK